MKKLTKTGLCAIPLYRQIALAIQDQLGVRYQVGDRLPTESEFAEQFGVSLITIKGALAELRSKGFIHSRRGSRTRVKKVKPTGRVAVLIDLDYELPSVSPFYRYMVQYVAEELNSTKLDYRIYKGSLEPGVCPTALTCTSFERDREAGLIGSVIAIGTDPTLEWYEETTEAGIPVLGCSHEYQHAVFQNSVGAMDVGFSRLISAGCKNIAAVGWEGFHKENEDSRSYYHRILKTYGISGSNLWFKSDLHPVHNGAGWEEFREIWTSHGQKPDALLVLDGELLPGVRQAMHDLGLCPGKDITVISKMSDTPEFHPVDGIHYLLLSARLMAGEMVLAHKQLLGGEYIGHRLTPYRFAKAVGVSSHGMSKTDSWLDLSCGSEERGRI